MAGNILGTHLKLMSFGESHGSHIGGVLEGLPSGIEINLDDIQQALDRRKPGQNSFASPRNEADKIQIISGVFEGVSTRTPIAFIIANKDQRSKDYSHLKEVYRTGHADKAYESKYGIRDHRGGGRASARETAVRVAGAGICKGLLPDVEIRAYVSSIGPFSAVSDSMPSQEVIDSSELRMIDPEASQQALAYLQKQKESGDSSGGVIHCFIDNIPSALGEPVYQKLHASLGSAMLSINAVKGVEFGAGFDSARMSGSTFYGEDESYNSGGIYGGISSGDAIHFKVAFKPISSSVMSNKPLDKEGNPVEQKVGGRHDVCVVPRAVPIVEAMARLVISDFYLLQKIHSA